MTTYVGGQLHVDVLFFLKINDTTTMRRHPTLTDRGVGRADVDVLDPSALAFYENPYAVHWTLTGCGGSYRSLGKLRLDAVCGPRQASPAATTSGCSPTARRRVSDRYSTSLVSVEFSMEEWMY